MDVIDLLTKQHRDAEQLLEQLEKADEGERAPLVAELDQMMSLHMQIEEEVVYPFMAARLDDGEEQQEEAVAEHDLAREGLQKMQADPQDPGFDGLVAMVKAGIAHHVEEEEGEMFPKLEEQSSPEERAELAERSQALAGGLPLDVPEDGAKAVRGTAEVDLEGMTKEELYEQAKEADISGRSDMTKDQLVKALREQG